MPDDRLYELLPAVHRMRDAELGSPLRTVLRVIASQIEQLEADIGRLYDDWFIETCQDAVIPLLGELVGVTLDWAGGTAMGSKATPIATRQRRRQVADALTDRKAKGTVAALERLAFDVAGWPARAIELAPLVSATAAIRHPSTSAGGLVATFDAEELEQTSTPFGTTPKLADVRRISSHHRRGLCNVPGVAVALWRLVADGVERAPAASVNDSNHYTFDALGSDTQLCTLPVPTEPGAPPTANLDVPEPITRLALERRLEDYYGPGRSLCVYRGGELVDRRRVVVADLSRWRARVPHGHLAIDPCTGRIAFPPLHLPNEGVFVTYRQLAVGPLGGGQYRRALPDPQGSTYRVASVASGGQGATTTIGAALAAWAADKAAGKGGPHAVIEILDDGVYDEHLDIGLLPGESLELRAAEGHRPIVRPQRSQPGGHATLRVTGLPALAAKGSDVAPAAAGAARRGRVRSSMRPPGKSKEGERPEDAGPEAPPPGAAVNPAPPPEFTLNGVWIADRALELAGVLGTVSLRHCTLVPAARRAQEWEGEASLDIRARAGTVLVDHCVLGRMRVERAESGFDPLPLSIADSVVDAADPDEAAVLGEEGHAAFLELSLERSTVLGGIRAYAVALVENSIITRELECTRRQQGAVRFSWLPPGSRTPRRTRCQPDGVLAAVDAAVADGTLAPSERSARRATEAARVRPRFDSVAFGASTYARLVDGTPHELSQGATDEGELGAYHDLWLCRRVDTLRGRLQECVPAGMDIDIWLAT